MPRLSIIMIVKNEAHCLGQCLESVRGIADEIVVADTGSSDETAALARELGARVFSIPWNDDFAQARNETIAAATGDWLLHMDADEELDPEGASALRALVDADGAGADAIEVTLANYCDDPRAWRWTPAPADDSWARGKSGYIAVELPRLFRKTPWVEYREPVHENITASVVEHGGRIARSGVIIHHHGFDVESTRRGAKAERYLRIARRKMEASPRDLKALHDFAEQALACGLEEEAEKACREALAIHGADVDSATTLSNLLLNRGDFAEARAVLSRLEQEGSGPPHVITALGALDVTEGKLASAEARLARVVAAAPDSLMARLYLARLYDRLGRADDAEAELAYCARRAPAVQEFTRRLEAHRLRRQGEAAYVEGKADEALRHFIAALRLDSEDPYTHNNLGVVLHGMGDMGRARDSFARALQLAHGMAEAQENQRALTGPPPARP